MNERYAHRYILMIDKEKYYPTINYEAIKEYVRKNFDNKTVLLIEEFFEFFEVEKRNRMNRKDGDRNGR